MKKTSKTTSKKDGNTSEILGVRLFSSSKERLLEEILRRVGESKKTFVVTPNPEFLVFAQKRPWFREILNRADIAIPDGIGLVWASRWLSFGLSRGASLAQLRNSLSNFRPLMMLFSLMSARKEKNCPSTSSGHFGTNSLEKTISCPSIKKEVIKERISGTDLMEQLCREAARHNWAVYFLGGQSDVAKKALVNLKKRYLGLRGWAEAGPRLGTPGVAGWTLPEWREKTKTWTVKINRKKPDLLFVAFGMGRQEKFLWDNWNELKVKLAMGVGGAFDYLSGEIPRAPSWMRKIGFEWFYRLLRQPQRWRRIWTAVFVFPFKVFLSSLGWGE